MKKFFLFFLGFILCNLSFNILHAQSKGTRVPPAPAPAPVRKAIAPATPTRGTSTPQATPTRPTATNTATGGKSAAPSSVNMATLEQDIVNELNRLRKNPKAYAAELRQLKFATYPNGDYTTGRHIYVGTDRLISCYDGACETSYLKKLNEAIAELEKLGALSQLTVNAKAAGGAKFLSADAGKINGAAHKDSQNRGLFCRCRTAGYNFRAGECLSAGSTTAKGFIIGFLTSAGHRKILVDASYDEVGVDTHLHGSGKDAYIRCVIVNGDKDAGNSPDACAKGW